MEKTKEFINIPITKIYPNPYQPRRHFDMTELSALSESIKEIGVITPISVRRMHSGEYELIAGERRLRAAQDAGLSEIPAVVSSVSDAESALISIVENIQRKDLNCFEEAESMYNLLACHGITQEELAKKLGKSQACIANKLRLLRLSMCVRKKINEYNLTERHARALLRIPDEDRQLALIEKISKGSLTVSATEKIINKELSNFSPKMEQEKPSTARLYVNTLAKTVEMLKKSGASLNTREIENDDYIEYIIRLDKIS